MGFRAAVPAKCFFPEIGNLAVNVEVLPLKMFQLASERKHFAAQRCSNLERGGPGVFVKLADRKSTRLNSSHGYISYAVFCLKKKTVSRSSITEPSTTDAARRAADRAIACLSPVKGGAIASLKGSKSFENLKEAFAGDSQANRRYLYFARVADIEGFPDIAGLFKDTADAETGHAFGHLDFLKEVGDPATGEPIGKTEKNLKAAVAGETYEYTQMYPGMAKTARSEGFNELGEWFETLAKAEKSHAGRFNKGLQQIAGKDPAEAI